MTATVNTDFGTVPGDPMTSAAHPGRSLDS
jgi:hypothetical protein